VDGECPPAFGLVIPDFQAVIPAPDQVRGSNIRDPVPRDHWIAGQARNDKPTARNDKPTARNDNPVRRIGLAGRSAQELLGSDTRSYWGQTLITLYLVIPDLIRDPVLREHWIAGRGPQ